MCIVNKNIALVSEQEVEKDQRFFAKAKRHLGNGTRAHLVLYFGVFRCRCGSNVLS